MTIHARIEHGDHVFSSGDIEIALRDERRTGHARTDVGAQVHAFRSMEASLVLTNFGGDGALRISHETFVSLDEAGGSRARFEVLRRALVAQGFAGTDANVLEAMRGVTAAQRPTWRGQEVARTAPFADRRLAAARPSAQPVPPATTAAAHGMPTPSANGVRPLQCSTVVATPIDRQGRPIDGATANVTVICPPFSQ